MDRHAEQFGFAPMSGVIIVSTVLCVVLGVAVPIVLAVTIPSDQSAGWPVAAATAAVWATFVMVWAVGRPLEFVVSQEGLTVRWPLRRRRIPLGAIREVRRVAKADLGWTMRTCGAGGFLGGFGRFHSRRLGALDAYVANARDLVLVRLDGPRPLLITPDRADGFVAALRAATGLPG